MKMNNPNLEDLISSIDEKISLFEEDILNDREVSLKQSEANSQIDNLFKDISEQELNNRLYKINEEINTIDNDIELLKKQLFNKLSKNIDMVYLMAKKIFPHNNQSINNAINIYNLTDEELNLFLTYLHKSEQHSLEYDFIIDVKENIELPITMEKIIKCKKDMLDKHNSSISKFDKIQEIWRNYDNLNEYEFKQKIDEKTIELNNLLFDLNNMGNEIFDKYSNKFDMVNLFYDYVCLKSDEFLRNNFSFTSDELKNLQEIKNKKV